MHVYKFTQAGAKLDLQGDTFEQLKPGLSSFADDPQAAAESLQPLLDTAIATVPEAQRVRVAGDCARRGTRGLLLDADTVQEVHVAGHCARRETRGSHAKC